MSVVVAMRESPSSWIVGSDGVAIAGNGERMSETERKWIHAPGAPFVVGCAGCSEIRDLVGELLFDYSKGPAGQRVSVREFARDLRRLIRSEEWGPDKRETGGPDCYDVNLLVADGCALYEVYGRIYASEVHEDARAIGQGCEVAIGAMQALSALTTLDPIPIVYESVGIAKRRMNCCGGETFVHRVSVEAGGPCLQDLAVPAVSSRPS